MRLFQWLRKYWRQRRREMDVEHLWPKLRDHTDNINEAKSAFSVHAFHDPAWRELGTAEIYHRINKLS